VIRSLRLRNIPRCLRRAISSESRHFRKPSLQLGHRFDNSQIMVLPGSNPARLASRVTGHVGLRIEPRKCLWVIYLRGVLIRFRIGVQEFHSRAGARIKTRPQKVTEHTLTVRCSVRKFRRFFPLPVARRRPNFIAALGSPLWRPNLLRCSGSRQTDQRKTCADRCCQP
jgi:hypothetical protein